MIAYNDGTTEHGTNLERPRTDVRKLANLGALNAEIILALNGESSASFDVRGTSSVTLVVEGTKDGSNYITLPFYNPLTEIFLVNLSNANGSFEVPNIASFRAIRVRCVSYSSGLAVVCLNASLGNQMLYAKPIPTVLTVTILGVANAAATLTIPSAGTGLFHYITSIIIKRVNNSAAAITGSALLAIGTTNITGGLAFSSGNALAAGDDKTDVDLNFTGNPLKSTTANTNTTIVLPPAGAGVQYRATVTYYTGA